MAREPTEKGRDLYNLIGGDQFLQAHKSRLFEQIDIQNLRTAYDVQEYAYVVLLWLKDDPIFDNIKRILYNAPATEIQNEEALLQPTNTELATIVLSFPYLCAICICRNTRTYDNSMEIQRYEENGIHYAYCETFDILGYGNTEEEAIQSYKTMLVEILTDAVKNDHLDALLSIYGWEQKHPPILR